MSEPARRHFVSVKFTPAGRTASFLLPDIVVDDFGPGDSDRRRGAGRDRRSAR
jgi:hypothetical protein